MCGIVGEYIFNKNYNNRNIELLLDQIKTRGPDYSGSFVNKCTSLCGNGILILFSLNILSILNRMSLLIPGSIKLSFIKK